MDEGQGTRRSTPSRSLGGTRDLGHDEIISNSTQPTASSAKRSRTMFELDVGSPNDQQKQQRASASGAVPHIFPSFTGEFARDFQAPEHSSSVFHASQNTLQPELLHQQLRNVEMGGNYGGCFPVTSATAQGNGNYHMPTSNFTKQLLGESSSRVQLPPTLDSSYKGHDTGDDAVQRITNFSFWWKQGLRGNIIHPKLEVGESSKSVKMQMTMPDNSQQSTELQMGSFLNPTNPSNGNPQLPRKRTYNVTCRIGRD
ncbi:hypothetical protein VNO78_34808 [Psophocarpus tetragonolobus]|uniref:Uncharacterized protein n=1 Tax=Psophocarpus tetragonolobus TaxID=3891 RepID=A0AAN9NSS7_PSOTE